MPDGSSAHVRVAAVPRKRCAKCGRMTSDLDCDGAAAPEAMQRRRNKDNTTCNARLCRGCAVRVGELDYCPRCAGAVGAASTLRDHAGSDGDVSVAGDTPIIHATSTSHQRDDEGNDMGNGVNKVILVGNLGKDPEVRYTQQGKAVCTLRLACGERRKEGDGWRDHTEWMDVVIWEKTAENAGQYLKKGSQVYCEGKLQTRQYKDKEGIDRYKTEVVAFTLVFLGGKADGAPAAASKPTSTSANKPAQQQNAPPPAEDIPFDDDLPF